MVKCQKRSNFPENEHKFSMFLGLSLSCSLSPLYVSMIMKAAEGAPIHSNMSCYIESASSLSLTPFNSTLWNSTLVRHNSETCQLYFFTTYNVRKKSLHLFPGYLRDSLLVPVFLIQSSSLPEDIKQWAGLLLAVPVTLHVGMLTVQQLAIFSWTQDPP